MYLNYRRTQYRIYQGDQDFSYLIFEFMDPTIRPRFLCGTLCRVSLYSPYILIPTAFTQAREMPAEINNYLKILIQELYLSQAESSESHSFLEEIRIQLRTELLRINYKV
jgi:hypothetical protein